jgi:rod shape-determining protein MreD
MRAAAVLFATLYLLHALVAAGNTLLSGLHLWLFAGGLYVAYGALFLPLAAGLAAAVLAGFLCDAMSPLAFGTQAVLFAAAHVAVFNARERLQREETAVQVLVVLVLNAALFLVLSLLRLRLMHGVAGAGARLLSDLVWSEAILATVTPWFFALQAQTLVALRLQPARAA